MPRAKGGSIPPPRVAVQANHGGSISELNENDVLSGRGGRINNHPGNTTFRIVVEDYKREYLDPRTRKLEKAHVAARLVAQIRGTNPPGRFLREDTENPGKYVEIGDQKAWKKAGQALREDASDVRKEIDEDMEIMGEKKANEQEKEQTQAKFTPQHQPSYQQHQQPTFQQQQQRPGVPPGIPPSVSYSPTSAQPMPLAPPPGPRSRPDPPEAPGVTGYRQAPLRYVASGRGGAAGRIGAGGVHTGRGRGPPLPQHHHQQPPQPHQYPGAHLLQQQGYHSTYYGHHPPINQPPGPNQPNYAPHHGQPQPQFQHPPGQFPQQMHPHHPQYPPQHHHGHHPTQQHPPNGYTNGPQPQFTAPQDQKKGRKGESSLPNFAGPVEAVVKGVHNAMNAVDVVSDLASKLIHKRHSASDGNSDSRGNSNDNSTLSPGGSFPMTKSVGSEFTLSDISKFGDSSTRTNPAMMQSVQHSGQNPHQPTQVATSNEREQQQEGLQKQSTNSASKSSGESAKSRESFTMSDLMASDQSLGLHLGHSGRTRSFPDLMLSTGDLLPPLEGDDYDSDVEILDDRDASAKDAEYRRTSSGRMLRASFHRRSSSSSSNPSMTSLTLKGFHPIGGRNNTATSGINDAMSIMSLESRRSMRSESSSWLENFKSMQSIHSDMNPWENGSSANNRSLVMGDEGSVKSFLSDVSNDLNALDLAEPLLPPIMTDSGLHDSLAEFTMSRPDP